MRLYLPEGDHVFRAAFMDDDFVKKFTTTKEAYNDKKNKFHRSITFVGPFPSKVEKASRKKILICDPNSGRPASRRSSPHLAHPRLPASGDQGGSGSLMKFVSRWPRRQGQSDGTGNSTRASRRCWFLPQFLFRIERDPDPTRSRTDAPRLRPRTGFAAELFPVELDAG